MPKKHTIEFIRKEFENQKFKLLSKNYINNTQKLDFICSKGHQGIVTYISFRKNQGCFICGTIKTAEKQTLPYEVVKKKFEEKGYTLLSTEYNGNKHKLDFICPVGHRWKICYDKFNKGRRCGECYATKKLTYTFVNNEFKKKGYKLLSTEYIKNSQKLKYICKNGHKGEIIYNSFQQGNGCAICANNKTKTIEFIKNEFEKQRYTLISKKYNSNKQHLKYQCPTGHYYSITYSNFKKGHGCPYCIYKKEQETREILETLYASPFPKQRPKWLNGMELDGYNEELGLAFEYQGEQHYHYHPKLFHKKGIKKFLEQHFRDKIKVKLCQENNVKLVVIPYYIKNKEEFILNSI